MTTALSEFDLFLEEFHQLCHKHDIALIVTPGGIAEVFKNGEPIRKIGEFIYICAGRTGYGLRTKERPQ